MTSATPFFRLSCTGGVLLAVVGSGLLISACGGSSSEVATLGTANAPEAASSTTSPVAPPVPPVAASVTAPAVAPSTTAPANSTIAKWSACANEFETCSFAGTSQVRYGLNGRYVYGTFTGTVRCHNDVFGDPSPGDVKRCEVADQPVPGGGLASSPTPTTASTPTPAPSSASTASSTNQGPMPTPQSIAGKERSGRIVARSGQVIENVHVTNPNGTCIEINGVTDVVIRNSEIGPCGSEGNDDTHGIGVFNSSNITIERNVIHDVSSAVYAMDSRHPIVMDRNYVYNVRGPFPRGQMIQMNRVTGGSAPSRITCNLSDAMPGTRYGVAHGVTSAGVEDHINMFQSPGLAEARTLIAYNRLRGGHKTSRSGSGIMLGDYGGGRATIRGNVVVNVANVGIGIAGGSDVSIEENLIFQHRDAGIYVNLGIMVWDVAGTSCPGGHAVRGNRVFTFNSLGQRNSYWDAGNCGVVNLSGNAFDDVTLTASLFDQAPASCR